MIVLIGLLCTKLVGANFEHVYSRRVGSVVLIGSNLFFPVTKWIRKNRQMSIKVAQNDFTSKMMILTPLQKCLIMWGGFGQINCCQRLKKVAKSSGHTACNQLDQSASLIFPLDGVTQKRKKP